MTREVSQSAQPESPASTLANGDHCFLLGSSLVMRVIQHVIADMSPTDLPVLLMGERGTGKEALALHIHRSSHRRDQAFHKLDSAGLLAETLHRFLVRPANGDGSVPSAPEGTLFLDGVSELELACQSALSDFLAHQESLPEGQPVGARVICSTTRSLEDRIRAGHFREELYYQISSVSLRLPPLRHRKADIPAFLDFFFRKSATEFRRAQPALSPWVQKALLDYPWPGNVRELENAVRSIVALGDEGLGVADLYRSGLEFPPGESAPAGTSLKEAARAASRRAERELMLRVLTRTRWNRKLAAKELQISYKALLYKLKYLGLGDAASS